MLPFHTYIDFNFNVQNDSDETLTITGKTTDPACGFTAGFDPPDEQGVTSNGGKGHFSVMKLLSDICNKLM